MTPQSRAVSMGVSAHAARMCAPRAPTCQAWHVEAAVERVAPQGLVVCAHVHNARQHLCVQHARRALRSEQGAGCLGSTRACQRKPSTPHLAGVEACGGDVQVQFANSDPQPIHACSNMNDGQVGVTLVRWQQGEPLQPASQPEDAPRSPRPRMRLPSVQ
jgi:hypothetical protein